MRTIKKMKEFLKAERKELPGCTLLLDGDEWVNEEFYSTDPCAFCRSGCVYSDNFTGGANEAQCLNCGQWVYWDYDVERWRRI